LWDELEISGRVLYRDERRKKRPLTAVEFWQTSPRSSEKRLSIEVGNDGAFNGRVTVIDHVHFSTTSNGKRKERLRRRSAVVVLKATGCDDKTITVERKWKPKTIVMQCRQDQSESG